MIRSMTAYAGGEQQDTGLVIAWEVRTVNHRFLDVSLRLPDAFRFMESDIKALIGQHLKRGRVEASLTLRQSESGAAAITLNRPLVEQLLRAVHDVEQLAPAKLAPVNAFQVLAWPGALHQPEADREHQTRQILALLEQTLAKVASVRKAEGRQLALLIEQRCQKIAEQVSAVRAHHPVTLAAIRAKIQARIQEVTATPDHDRLEQELVYLTQKLDVAEELDRLDTHLAEIHRSLQQNDPVGRRLDFLMQELNREANTLGSKSADSDTTRSSVDIKVLIEQMREQVQNIE